MKITVRPSFLRSRSVLKSSSTSCGTKTAVGSSKIKIFAPRYNTLRISIRCLSPTPSSLTNTSGSTARPFSAAISEICLRAFAKSKRIPFFGSLPKTIFSKTVKLSANIKCWCTMPIPESIASEGELKTRSLPLIEIVPSSAFCMP